MKILRTFDKEDFLSKYPQHKDAKATIKILPDYYFRIQSQDDWDFYGGENIEKDTSYEEVNVFENMKKYFLDEHVLYISNSRPIVYSEEDLNKKEEVKQIDPLAYFKKYIKENKTIWYPDSAHVRNAIGSKFELSRPLWEDLAPLLKEEASKGDFHAYAFPYELLEYIKDNEFITKHLEERKLKHKDYLLPKFMFASEHKYVIAFTKDLILKYKDIIDTNVEISEIDIRISEENFLELYSQIPFDIWLYFVKSYNAFESEYITKIQEKLDENNCDFQLNIEYALNEENYIYLMNKTKANKYDTLAHLLFVKKYKEFVNIIKKHKDEFDKDELLLMKKYLNKIRNFSEVPISIMAEILEVYDLDPEKHGFWKLNGQAIVSKYIYPGTDGLTINEEFKNDIETYLSELGFTHYEIY